MFAIQAAVYRNGFGLLLGYTGLMIVLWTLVNQIYLGRVHVLGLSGEQAHIAGKHELDGDRWYRNRLYLESRKLLAQLAERWRPVLDKDLLSEATECARKLGYRIAPDWLNGHDAVQYSFRNQSWIVIDQNLPRHERAMQILEAIHYRLAYEEPMSADMRRELVRISLGGKRRSA